jgi:hypothetical protein
VFRKNGNDQAIDMQILSMTVKTCETAVAISEDFCTLQRSWEITWQNRLYTGNSIVKKFESVNLLNSLL